MKNRTNNQSGRARMGGNRQGGHGSPRSQRKQQNRSAGRSEAEVGVEMDTDIGTEVTGRERRE